MKKDFEILEHRADLKIKAYGKSLKELFLNMAKGMFSVLKQNQNLILPKIQREIFISSFDQETLLVDFLSELLTLADTYNEVYPLIKISRLTDKEIEAEVFGDKVSGFDEDIKAVTYHGVKIEKTEQGYEAVVLFDI